MKNNKPTKQIPLCFLCLALALFSFFSLSKLTHSSKSAYFAGLQATLDTRLAASAGVLGSTLAAGTAVSALPIGAFAGNMLAEVAKGCLAVMGAITLEKLLLSLAGYLAFKILFPASLLLVTISFCPFAKKGAQQLRKAAVSLGVLGIVFFGAVPLSFAASNAVEKIFLADYLAQTKSRIDAENASVTEIVEQDAASGNLFDRLKGAASNALTWVKSVAANTQKSVETLINQCVHWLVAMLITTCIIPILTILGVGWAAKHILMGILLRHDAPTLLPRKT